MKNLILTGATSMIGAAIVKEALARNMGVAAVIRGDSPRMDNLGGLMNHQNLRVIECDIHDYKNLVFDAGYYAFIHLAWQSTGVDFRDDVYAHVNNITYTLDAVHAAHRAGCNAFVSAGSQAEYGLVSEKLSGDTVCNPESGYGVAKYAAGKMARLAASQLGIRYCHTRILSTYGEGMDGKSLVIYLIKTLLKGEKPSLTKCEQIWDFMYARDTARAMLAAAENGVDGKTYPIGSGNAKTLREYVEMIRDIINPSIEIGFGEKEYYPHQPMFLCADINELRNDTGFEPATGFEDGIRMTADWVKSRLEENRI